MTPPIDLSSNKAARSLLERVRRIDLSSYSDEGLKSAFADLRDQARHNRAEEVLPTVSAIVAEVVNRRLGVWRIFDKNFQAQRFEKYRNFAASGLGLRESASLSVDETTIVAAMARVAGDVKVKRPWEIILPADFYQATLRLPSGNLLAFRPTDEQLLAGMHLFNGNIVQMNAGEGKTVAGALAAVLQAVLGRSVHVVTANEYLAARDAQLLAPVYESLGISVGAVIGYMDDGERRHNYRKNVVYGAMREFGFDFLRDNLKTSRRNQVQRGFDVAIVDEVDHALIDEAFTPMIISGSPLGNRRATAKVKKAVNRLVSLQQDSAQGLANQLTSPGPGSSSEGSNSSPASFPRGRESITTAAKLLLADPGNAALRRYWGDNPGHVKRAKLIAESELAELASGLFYAVDPDSRYVTLTELGRDHLVQSLGPFYDGTILEVELDHLRDRQDLPLPERRKKAKEIGRRLAKQYSLGNQVYQMLRACLLLKRDVDYLVNDDSLVLIDRATGRPRVDFVYQHGLQSALELKEGLTPRPETETLGQMTVEGLVKRYKHVSGMTGTATGSADEFQRRYGLRVVELPPSRPLMRVDLPDRVYLNNNDKTGSIVDQVIACRRVGQPVLVGTVTVEDSQDLSRLLREHDIPHNLLNAVTSDAEAQIIRDAGAFGAVTVATNMAGRGTDILLEPGLNSRIARQFARAGKTIEHFMGLRVIGSEVNKAARIDLQLNGRSGRQGESGVTQTFLSLEDRLLGFHAEAILKMHKHRKVDEAGLAFFEGKAVDDLIGSVQKTAEHEAEAQLGLMQDYAAVLDRQTDLFYQHRRRVMESNALPAVWTWLVNDVAARVAADCLPEVTLESYPVQFDQMANEILLDYRVDCFFLKGCDLTELPGELGRLFVSSLEELGSRLGTAEFASLSRLLYLKTCDDLWKTHLTELQESVSNQMLSSHSHKSAVARYVKRSFKAWDEFLERVKSDFLSRLLTFPIDRMNRQPTQPVRVHEDVHALIAQFPMVCHPKEGAGHGERRD